MRCPKCGYTSFDNLERCKKCKKNIAAAAAALMGTVANAASPSFLIAAEPAGSQATAPAATDTDIDLNIDDAATLDLSNGEDELFSLNETAPEADSVQPVAAFSDDNEIDLRLSDRFKKSSALQEPALDMELDLALDEDNDVPLTLGSDSPAEYSHPSLDLDGLDISDLQGPETSATQEIALEPALNLTLDDEPLSVQAASQGPARVAPAEFSLEDLHVEDLDVAKSDALAADNHYQPAMKTGTALDNFNFELDELLEIDENEKA